VPAARAETPQGGITGLDSDSAIFFALASTVVDDAGREVLRRHAARLQSDPRLTVTLSGYTDDLGSREYNIALGQKRVDAVEQELRALRVPAKQIRKRAYGYEKARPQRCASDACRQGLRRVQLEYTN
jgi:peptidoglycan-associated lipoprotein